MPRKVKRLAVVDIETDPFLFGRRPRPFMVGFYDGDNYEEFCGEDCIDQLFRYLDGKEYLIYAHNGGKFDYFFMIEYFDKKLKIINGRIAKASYGLNQFRDSYLILPLPLSAYKKDEIDYKIMEADERIKPKNDAKIRKYLYGDCVYLYEWIKKFTDRFGRKLTLASAAFDQLEKSGYKIPPGSEYFDEKMRPFYFGGRVEAIQPGKHEKEFRYVDLNSAYPRAMLEPHPYGREMTITDKPPKNGGMHFARILARSNGALPFRITADNVDEFLNSHTRYAWLNNKEGKKRLVGMLLFPRDNVLREYLTTSWEIDAGIETGTLQIKKYLEVYAPKYYKDFSPYVNKYYAEKKQGKEKGDKDLETFAKLMLNSAYGKFGLDPRKFKEYCLIPVGRWPDGEGWSKVISDNGYCIWERDDPGHRYYNVATAGSITGYVRANLWRAICASDNPIYCDTDAFIAEDVGRVAIGTELGEWKIEADVIEAHIAGKKLYAVKTGDVDKKGNPIWKTASKGARLSHEQICRICAGESINWKKDAPAYSLRYGVRFIEREVKMLVNI